ncbi:MAG: hypothetical protein M1319_01915, partial [Chloroflexi bacterium]|nr:hypothetical protein [Chloroflexota bacterium]
MTTSGKPWNAFSSQANLWCRPASQEEGHAREHGKHFGTSGRPGGAASAALDAGGGPVAAGRVDPPYAPWDQPRTTAPRTLLRRAILGLFYLAGLPWAHSPDPAAGRPPKILLLRPDHLGDVLLSFPAMAALHCEFPQSEIVLAVGPWSKEIAGHNEDVTSTITIAFPGFDRTRRGSPLAPYRLLVQTASALRRQEFDLAINLRNDFWWGSLLTYLARIPWRYGYAYPESSRFLTNWLAPKDQHVADQSLMLVRRASADFASSIRGGVASSTCRGEPAARPSELDTNSTYPIFRPWSDEVARARRVLDLNGISAGNRLVVVHPGAGADVKLWTAEGWGAVARYLIDSCGAAVAITGSAGEKALTQEIVAKSGREVVNLAG